MSDDPEYKDDDSVEGLPEEGLVGLLERSISEKHLTSVLEQLSKLCKQGTRYANAKITSKSLQELLRWPEYPFHVTECMKQRVLLTNTVFCTGVAAAKRLASDDPPHQAEALVQRADLLAALLRFCTDFEDFKAAIEKAVIMACVVIRCVVVEGPAARELCGFEKGLLKFCGDK